MSLVMTGDEFNEAYPNGMDEQDVDTWELAVDRQNDITDCQCPNAEHGYCPDCGYDATQAAELAIGC